MVDVVVVEVVVLELVLLLMFMEETNLDIADEDDDAVVVVVLDVVVVVVVVEVVVVVVAEVVVVAVVVVVGTVSAGVNKCSCCKTVTNDRYDGCNEVILLAENGLGPEPPVGLVPEPGPALVIGLGLVVRWYTASSTSQSCRAMV